MPYYFVAKIFYLGAGEDGVGRAEQEIEAPELKFCRPVDPGEERITMSDQNEFLQDEEALMEAVAEGLRKHGFAAAAQNTGGDMLCVVIEQPAGEVTWGIADVTWGAVVTDDEGEYVSAIQSTCRSDNREIAEIVNALRDASLANGVVLQ